MDFFKEYFDIWIFFNFKYDKCSSAGPKSYLLGMTSYIYCLGRSSVWWNVTRWGFGSWKVPDPQRRPFPRREPNPRKLGPLPHPLHLTRAGQYDCYEPWGAAQGGKPHGHTCVTPSINLRNQCGCIYICEFGYVPTCPSFSRDTCTATGKRLRKWMGVLSAPLRLLVVRPYPKPLPSLSRHKPLTSTWVSSPTEGGGCHSALE